MYSTWRLLSLSEIADDQPNSLVDGPFGSDLKTDEYTDEGVRLIQLQNIGDGIWIDSNKKFTSERKFLQLSRHAALPGDIAVAKMADPIARACIIPPVSDRFLVVADCIKLRLNKKDHDPKYIVAAINHHARHEAELKSTGTTRQRINLSILKSIKIPAPSLKEQRRIAEVLDTTDEAIQKTESLIAKLKAMKQGLLHDLLTRGIDENGKLRDPNAHPEQFKNSPFGRIPRKCKIKRCKSICHEIIVGIVIRPAQYYRLSGVPILRSANIREDGIDPTDLVYMSEESNALLSKSQIHTGDVLTVRTGYPGTSCVVTSEFNGANCVDLIISRPGPKIISEYLAIWINSDLGKNQVLKTQGGLAQQHFNVGELEKLLICSPDLSEQMRILDIFRSHSARLHVEEHYFAKLNIQKKGLMHDLLTGRVRVKVLN